MARCNPSSISNTLLFIFLVFLLVHCSETQGQQSTHLHFYFHEILSGSSATAARVVNSGRQNSFGAVGVIDDMLREGSDPSSKLIGRAQGIYTVSSIENGGLATMLEIVFTDGSYSGSSLTVVGRLGFETVRERTIVGGTGAFRMARGYMLNKIVSSSQGTVIFETDAYISH